MIPTVSKNVRKCMMKVCATTFWVESGIETRDGINNSYLFQECIGVWLMPICDSKLFIIWIR